MVAPIIAEIKLPKIIFLGWASGLLGAPNSNTDVAPKVPIRNKKSWLSFLLNTICNNPIPLSASKDSKSKS